jgi:hypothetical protein
MITLARYQLPNPELLIGFDLYYGLFQDIRYDIALSQGHNVDALEFEFVFFNGDLATHGTEGGLVWAYLLRV